MYISILERQFHISSHYTLISHNFKKLKHKNVLSCCKKKVILLSFYSLNHFTVSSTISNGPFAPNYVFKFKSDSILGKLASFVLDSICSSILGFQVLFIPAEIITNRFYFITFECFLYTPGFQGVRILN